MIDTSSFYILGWAILFFGCLGLCFLAFNRSKEEKKIKNTAIIAIAGLVVALLYAMINPIRTSSTPSGATLNMKIDPDSIHLPERITIEPKLTDEKRKERLQELRESAKEMGEEELSQNKKNDN